MRFFYFLVVVVSTLATPTLHAQLLPGIHLPELRLPKPTDPCMRACDEDREKDELFPSGIVHQSCTDECLGIERQTPPSPGVRPSGNNRAFVLLETMRYEIGTSGLVIEVPAGFVTDYASIPSFLWSLYSPHDQYSRAAIVHDFLYWSQVCTRPQADNLFMIAMRESDVPEKTRNDVYSAVVKFGSSSWEENRRQKEAGMLKVVPIERKDFPPNWSWEMYRQHLMKLAIKDPAFTEKSYCALGNDTKIPAAFKQSSKINNKTAPKVATRARDGIDIFRLFRGPYWNP